MTGQHRTSRGTSRLYEARKLIVKIGSALLVDERTGQVRHDWLDGLCEDIAALKERGAQGLESVALGVGRCLQFSCE